MSRKAFPVVLWLAVFALLLKSAVPMFAAGAAQWRGVAVADVCPLYGVSLVPAATGAHAHHHGHAVDAGGPGHEHHEALGHGGDHCALSGLAAAAPPEPPLPPGASADGQAHDVAFVFAAAARDAAATWLARLKHGPPDRA